MNIGGTIIWLLSIGLCAVTFAVISIWSTKRKDPMHFWSGEEIPADKVTDIPAWNAAYAKMWGVYAALFALSGVLIFWSFAAAVTLLIALCTAGLVVLVLINNRIRKKYMKQ